MRHGQARRQRGRRAGRGLVLAVVLIATALYAGQWKSLREDGLHDPENPALSVLQSPGDALRLLPPDTAGNQVRWVKALEDGYIRPRSSLHGDKPGEILDSNVLMKHTGDAPYVLFPHKPHTQWLDCGNCHEEIFKSKAGATPVNMLAILQGEYCGRCHGAVSFPLTECNRCHSVPQEGAPGTARQSQ